MSEKKFIKGSEEWIIFMDFWEISQKYWNVEGTDEYWRTFISDVDKMCEKHNNNFFVKKILFALMDYLEYKYKNKEWLYGSLDGGYSR